MLKENKLIQIKPVLHWFFCVWLVMVVTIIRTLKFCALLISNKFETKLSRRFGNREEQASQRARDC